MSNNTEYSNPLFGITKFFSSFFPSSWNENYKNRG